jgi:radical SAM superfamily enzyme
MIDRKLYLSRDLDLTNTRANARVPPSQQARRRYATVATAIVNTSLIIPQRDGLDTKFKCVFCNSEDSISTKIDKKAGVASLSCKNCVQSYQMSANCTP